MPSPVHNRIIGIDPGYAITGYGIIDKCGNRLTAVDYGVIETKPKMDFPVRLLAINDKIRALIEQYNPELRSVEELFMGNNHTTVIGTAQARGVAVVEAARAGIDVYEFTPGQVKLAITGYGKAEKRQVQLMTKSILSLDDIPKPDDAADALALAICLANSGIQFAQRSVAGYQYGRYVYTKRNDFG